MSQTIYPPLRTHPSLSLIVINPMDYGLIYVPSQGDVCLRPTSISSTIPFALMSHPLQINCSPKRHASGLIPLRTMSSSQSLLYPPAPFDSLNLIHSHAIYSEEALLAIIFGVDEGSAQGISWDSLPLIRSFVKERLALAAFLNCICSSRSVVGPSWRSALGPATSDFLSGHSLFEGNTLTFGCNCSGWKEGAIGTLSCRSRKDCDTLQQEIFTLSSVYNNFPSRYSIFCSG